ncbi:unnamed protein product [Acanthoscelides obtectus]|uniref:Multidrug resistance-associated protein lethal(2)03659 n=1 Tax=Acanthoscelides obtectus TaxID=200917 RepID=A0A9P0LH74_ACAOB|nr:unnamed protein product [Acanthoscelides obtectus]CAK1636139.1 Probable multidrug resistance-associated protein lethal(2)03659 [Acanthoscelides obtectus]
MPLEWLQYVTTSLERRFWNLLVSSVSSFKNTYRNMKHFSSIERVQAENIRYKSNFFSIITFWYTLPIFNKGRKRDITEEDLTKPLNRHKSQLLGDKISRIWIKHKRPSMTKTILRTFYSDIILYGCILFVMEMVVRLSQPLFVGLYIRYFNPENLQRLERGDPIYQPTYIARLWSYWTPQSPIQKTEAYFMASGIILCSALVICTFHPFAMEVLHVGMQMRVACCSLIYRKALRIKLTSLGGQTVGNAVNLMSNDVNRFDMAPIFLHYLWIAPLQAICIVYFLSKEVGKSAFLGMLAIAIVVPVQVCFGIRLASLRKKAGARTDNRVRQMNEIIQSMQVIKMYAWENAFSDLIRDLRKKELKYLLQTSIVRGMIMSFIMFTTRFGIFITVMSYVLDDNEITAEKVFLVTSYYQVLRQTMTVFFPQGVALVAEAFVSIKRIEEFMLTEETDIGDPTPLDVNWLQKPDRYPMKINRPLTPGELPSVIIKHAIAKYGSDMCLHNINLEVWPGKLTIVIGPVGSGKTCLLNLIMGELELFSGKLITTGTISYASQEAWLFAGSVRQNILFGREFDLNRYRDVVKVCSLTRDFQLLPFGDRTIVGERGISLSGGQRARINLARAVYKRSEIYLLDDPLSAVDIQVGSHLFEKCIKEYLGDKIVVLVTHQLHYLRRADQILILWEGGVQARGTYQELSKTQGSFHNVMQESTLPEEEKESKKLFRQLSISSAAFNSMIDIEGKKAKPLFIAEITSFGKVDLVNYKEYFRAGGNWCIILIMVMFFLGAQCFASGGDFFLSKWVTLEELRYHHGDASSMGFYDKLSRQECIWIYTAIMLPTILVAITRSLIFFAVCMRASMRLHNRMFNSVVHASMYFFNTNNSGRILNRFSKDLGSVDELLPYAFIDTVQLLLNLTGAIIVLACIDAILLAPTAVVAVLFYIVRTVYIKTSRSVKRLEGVTRSPVFAHLNASLQGLATIRTNLQEQVLVNEFDSLQDVHSSAWFMFLGCSRAFGMWVDLICTLYIGLVTFSFILLSDSYNGSDVGLAITQCIGLSGLVQWGMRQSAELENQMTSVERVLEFTRIEHEPDLESARDKKPPASWPRYGRIEYIDVSMRYSQLEPPVLKHLNIVINPREKIGIVGRTGAGKSSLISTLFRLAYTEGQILIDYLDISVLGLHDLRKKISIIPQTA